MAGSPYTLSGEQVANAETIADVAHRRGLPDRAVVIALATAMQESRLRNLPDDLCVNEEAMGPEREGSAAGAAVAGAGRCCVSEVAVVVAAARVQLAVEVRISPSPGRSPTSPGPVPAPDAGFPAARSRR